MRPQVNEPDSGSQQQEAEWQPVSMNENSTSKPDQSSKGAYIAGRSPSGSWSLGSLIEETPGPRPPDSA